MNHYVLRKREFEKEKVDPTSITDQKATYTIRELYQRAEAGTLPPISRHDNYIDHGLLTNRFHTDLADVSAMSEQYTQQSQYEAYQQQQQQQQQDPPKQDPPKQES